MREKEFAQLRVDNFATEGLTDLSPTQVTGLATEGCHPGLGDHLPRLRSALHRASPEVRTLSW